MKSFLCGGLICLGVGIFAAEAPRPLLENNFETAEAGKLPDEFMVLAGEFVVKGDGTNQFLELPGTPLDSFAMQFGPAEVADVAVSARIFGTAKGRRFQARH